ncbi:MAG: hypothetical protein IPL89_17840 [Acidobacteria bacterium]|nr:hypothetical protein [Acidobacteriota bacterium]
MTLLKEVVDAAAARAPVALIGGLALAAHGVLRATRDADLLGTDPGFLRKESWDGFAVKGIGVTIHRGDPDDPLLGVVRLRREPEPDVDLVVGRERWLDDVLSRRLTLSLGGESIPVVDAPDLVLLKVDAGGPIDLIDARLLLLGPDGSRLRRDARERAAGAPRRVQDALAAMFAELPPIQPSA